MSIHQNILIDITILDDYYSMTMRLLTPLQKELIRKGKAFYDDLDDYYYSVLGGCDIIKIFIVCKKSSDYLPYVNSHLLDPYCVFSCESEAKADECVTRSLEFGISAIKIII